MTEMERLVQDLNTSPELFEKLVQQHDKLDSAVAAAREAGYAVDKDEAIAFLKAMQDSGSKELSEAQLDSVAGGKKRRGINLSLLFKDSAPEGFYASY